MIQETVMLKDRFDSGLIGRDASLTVYARDNFHEIDIDRRYPTVLICPGGGYECVSDREGEPVALAFLHAGYTAAVLRYSVAPARYPTQLAEASAAFALLRRNGHCWHVDENRMFVCGFSAGGHLAACLGTLWEEPSVCTALGLREGENRPAGMVLSYPVISAGPNAHQGSFRALLGDAPAPELLHKLSLEHAVTPQTAPAFIWTTGDDDVVPVENSLLMAGALKAAGVPCELHLYQSGVHGMSLADYTIAAPHSPHLINTNATWFQLALNWLGQLNLSNG